MKISPGFSTPAHYATEDQHNTRRNKRAISDNAPKDQQLEVEVTPLPASKGGGYTETTIDPNPGKKVENTDKQAPPSTLVSTSTLTPWLKKSPNHTKASSRKRPTFSKKNLRK